MAKSEQIVEKCMHDYFNSDGVCVDCGFVRSELYGEDHGIIKKPSPEKSILKDLENLPIPEAIKYKADEINFKMGGSLGKDNRKMQRIYFCIHCAYHEVGTPQDPKYIAQILGLKSGDITKAAATFSQVQTGYEPPIIQKTADDFLPKYCEQFDFSPEMIKEVLLLSQKVYQKNAALRETAPQNVAAGILYYYATTHGIHIEKKSYARLIKRTEVIVSQMYKEVAKIDNEM